MRLIQMSKRLAGFSIALGSVALVAGCHSTKSSETSASVYSQPAGASASARASQPTWYSSAGATSSSSQQSTGTAQSADISTRTAKGDVSIPLYEEQIVVGTRAVESGSVRLRKQVTTETVNQPVQIRKETLVVDREAASGTEALKEGAAAASGTAGTLGTPFEQGEMVIQLHSEEPVVEKRVVPTGRIVVQTRTNMEQTTVQREIRREKIDVEKIGNPQNVTISEKVGQQPHQNVGGTGTTTEQTKGTGTQSNDQKQSEEPKKAEDRTPPAEQP